MKASPKPVRKCHACLLNRGAHCWLYQNPREQWRAGRSCRALNDPTLYAEFNDWSGSASVMSRKDLRREVHRVRRHPASPEGRDWLAKRTRR